MEPDPRAKALGPGEEEDLAETAGPTNAASAKGRASAGARARVRAGVCKDAKAARAKGSNVNRSELRKEVKTCRGEIEPGRWVMARGLAGPQAIAPAMRRPVMRILFPEAVSGWVLAGVAARGVVWVGAGGPGGGVIQPFLMKPAPGVEVSDPFR